MKNIFPEPVRKLEKADIGLDGVTAYMTGGKGHQILFMSFEEDVILPLHLHKAQWGVVLEGRIELTIDGKKNVFTKGDRYFIPEGVKHEGKIFAGYSDMTFFDEEQRYKGIK